LLTESTLLAGLGGSLGLLLALWGMDALLALSPAEIPRLQTVSVDARVLGFTLALTLLTGLLFGLVPALQAARINLHESLKESGRGTTQTPAQRRIFSALVVAEVALALVVLMGAGLLLNSFLRLRRVELGIQTPNVLTVEVNLPSAHYNDRELRTQRLNFYGQVMPRLQALPGVVAVGAIDSLPLNGSQREWTFRKEGQILAPSERPVAGFQVATTDYFRAMGIELLRGRAFTEADRYETPQVVIVNESFARRFYPQEDPLGQRIIIRDRPQACEIVGIVNDVRHFGPHKEPGPEMYVPYNQLAVGAVPLVVRAKSEPAALAEAVRKEIAAVAPEVAVGKIRTMTQLMTAALAEWRFALLLLGLFAGVALLLAAVGIYGVMAYAVTRRRHEFGVRLALGAQAQDLLRLVLRQGMTLVLIGVALGVAAALALTRLLKTLLFGVSASDPLTFVGVALLLTFVALLACWIPARRATKVDPVIALRTE